MIKHEPLFEQPNTCSVNDLVGGFPPSVVGFNLAEKMYVYDPGTKILVKVFKVVDIGDGPTWMLLGEV